MRARLIAGAAMLGGVCGVGQAASPVQQSFQVSASIATGCAVTANAGSWGQINLGTVSGVASGTASGALVSAGGVGLVIDCTPGTALSISAGNGANPGAGTRQLALSTDSNARIPYKLYANGSATPWTSQSVPLAFPVGTSRLSLPISATATLPGVQRAGAYADTVQITLNW